MPIISIDLVTCDRCAGQVAATFSTDDGHEVCRDCINQFYTACDHCASYIEHTVTADGNQEICHYCANQYYTQCAECDRYSEDTHTTADGSSVCESCAGLHYWSCNGCRELIDSGDYCTSCEPYDTGCSCGSCSDGRLIYDYSYKPVPQFHGDGPLFLGAELEINVPDGDLGACADVAVSHLGRLGYLKEDGSIGHGFEIVTHPMSYPWAMDHFPWDMLASLRQNGCDADDNGLHVHVSRAAFTSPGHVYRWMKFLHRNARQVTTVARRGSNHWARFDDHGRQHVKSYAKGAKGDRYHAINTQNDDTFELRVFASSLDPREVKAALGLAAASVEYTQGLSVADIVHHSGWQWTSFVSWLTDRPTYTPLVRELEALACVS